MFSGWCSDDAFVVRGLFAGPLFPGVALCSRSGTCVLLVFHLVCAWSDQTLCHVVLGMLSVVCALRGWWFDVWPADFPEFSWPV